MKLNTFEKEFAIFIGFNKKLRMKNFANSNKYTCNEYREEMILLGLQKQLASGNLTSKERENLLREIAEVEKQMGID